jgi:alkaline phosphatase D
MIAPFAHSDGLCLALGSFNHAKAEISQDERGSWIDTELDSSTADIHIFGNHLQVISEEYPHSKWVEYPTGRIPLFCPVSNCQPEYVIEIRGNRHLTEVSRLDLNKNVGIFEMTSSSSTLTWDNYREESVIPRLKDHFSVVNNGLLTIVKTESVLTIKGMAHFWNITNFEAGK